MKPVRANWTCPDFVWNTEPKPKMGTPRIIDLLMEHHVGERRVCIQAGAHLGIWPAALADHFQKVVAFEPMLENWHAAVSAITANNVVVIPAALSSSWGLVAVGDFNKPDARFSGSVRITSGGQPAPAVTIDALAPFLGPIDALVLDVEGHEAAVLLGAAKTLLEHRPSVVMERCDHFEHPEAAPTYLIALGYRAVASYGADTVWIARDA